MQNGEGLVSKVKVALAKLNPVGPRSSCGCWEEVGDPAHRDEVILGGSKGGGAGLASRCGPAQTELFGGDLVLAFVELD